MVDDAGDLNGIDPALMQDFIVESQEILDGLDPLFVALETNPEDLSIVDGIFRPVHSVKGNSGFFNLNHIKSFAHVMENLLGEIRSRKRQASPSLIDLLLKGVDFLRGMMNRLAQGDLSDQLTPEEEAHLSLLNAVSSGEEVADSPQAAASRVMDLFEKVRSSQNNDERVAGLGRAIHDFIGLTVPEYFTDSQPKEKVRIDFRIGGEDVTGQITHIERFIAGLEEKEKDETACESFITALDQLAMVAAVHHPELCPLIDQVKDDFLTIHHSSIGFDALLTSLIRERFDAILHLVEMVEIGQDGDFYLHGENVTDVVRTLEGFVVDIQELDKVPAAAEKFVASLSVLRDLASDQPGLIRSIEQLLDDFMTIHEARIGFDDVLKGHISERLTAVLAYLERRSPAKVEYSMGGMDVTETIRTLSKLVTNPGALLTDAQFLDQCCCHLQTLGEAAEKTGKIDLGMTAAGLVAEIELVSSNGSFGENQEKIIIETMNQIMDGVEAKTIQAPVRESREPGPVEPAPATTDNKAQTGHDIGGKTLRVAEEKVDNFMNFVGELIITGEVFAYIQKKLEQYPEARQVAQEFKNANLAFGELSSNLQKSLMEVRRVPLKSVLQKLHRIIRDTAGQLGKKIELEIHGEEVQIDKSLLEGLESPLVHMVRNAVDHGIERPEERAAKNKPETGLISIHAAATEEQFRLAIRDDGKGLDVHTIKDKAVARGLLSEDQARTMPDRDAYRLIFNAGLSTAQVVTDVSGRGVGMDVVLSNITKMNGNIMVDSTLGSGTEFTILLPMTVTLTVIDGLVARIGDQFYIIPLADVRESVRPRPEQIHTVRGSQELLNVRGELRPIVRLYRVLGIRTGEPNQDASKSTAVLVQGKRGISAAFLVDELIGQQSVVVKELGKEFSHIRCIQGGSILGDGRVGLVLSIQGVLADIGLAPSED